MRTKCGAKTRTGAPCKAPAGKNGRCKMHGNGGALPDNANALKHGIYGRTVREHERDIHAEMRRSVGSVDDELSLVRLQLHRTLEAQNEAAENAHDGLELQKRHDREASEFGPGDEAVYERVDYGAHIDRLTARIGTLEKLRAELLQIDRDKEPDDDDEPPQWVIKVVPPKAT